MHKNAEFWLDNLVSFGYSCIVLSYSIPTSSSSDCVEAYMDKNYTLHLGDLYFFFLKRMYAELYIPREYIVRIFGHIL